MNLPRALKMIDADTLAIIRAGWRWDVKVGGEKIGAVWAVDPIDARAVVNDYFYRVPSSFEVVRHTDYSTVLGRIYRGSIIIEGDDVDYADGTLVLYLAIAWERATGLWMEALNTSDRRNISERAIDRTYHEVLTI